MGVAYYISLEKPIEGFNASSVSGKAVARAHPELEKICLKLKLPDLMSFYSEPPGRTAEAFEGAGDVLAQQLQELNELRVGLGKPPPKLSPSIEQLKKQVEGLSKEATKKASTQEQWFAAKDGLVTVRGLLQHLGGHTVHFGQGVRHEWVVSDLEQMERVLSEAEMARVGFHLSIDI